MEWWQLIIVLVVGSSLAGAVTRVYYWIKDIHTNVLYIHNFIQQAHEDSKGMTRGQTAEILKALEPIQGKLNVIAQR